MTSAADPFRFGAWRAMLATMASVDAKLAAFHDAVEDIAQQVAAGRFAKSVGVDELLDEASTCGLLDDIGREEIERVIGESFTKHGRKNSNGGTSNLGNDLKARYRINFTRFADIEQAPRKKYLVRDFLGAGELSCMFGPPGAAKSVLAGDLAAHVAWGEPWFGRAVSRCAVLYIAAERPALVKRRLAAFRLHHKVTDLPMAVVAGCFDFRTRASADAIVEIAKWWSDECGIETGLIIGDTTSRLLAGGDENSSKDMGAFIGNVAHIQERAAAHMMLLHHVPHDTQRMRGHGLQLAAMDTTISVEKRDGGIRTATVEKNNDGEEGLQVVFDLLSIAIAVDPEAGPTTAPVIRPAKATAAKSSGPKLTKNQMTMFAILRDAGPQGLSTKDWDDRARAEGIGTNRRPDLYDARSALKAKGLVRQYGERWTVVS